MIKNNYGKADEIIMATFKKCSHKLGLLDLSIPDLLEAFDSPILQHVEAKPLNVGVQEHHRQIQTMNAGRLLPWESAEGVKSPHFNGNFRILKWRYLPYI